MRIREKNKKRQRQESGNIVSKILDSCGQYITNIFDKIAKVLLIKII